MPKYLVTVAGYIEAEISIEAEDEDQAEDLALAKLKAKEIGDSNYVTINDILVQNQDA